MEENLEEPNAADIIASFTSDVELFFETITDDDGLADDVKADLIQNFEDIAELLDDSKKLVATSTENEQ